MPPSSPGLPLLVTSTDIRTPKVPQIAHTNTVELAWWIGATSDQFRIAGLARIFAAPEHAIHTSPRAALGAAESSSIDWEAKRRELFDAVSEHMRAAWCRPTPGTPLEGGYDEMNDWPVRVPKPSEARTEKEKELAKIALSNYALIVIEPVEVDWVQMAVQPNRRTFFTREGGGWKEKPVVP